MKSHARGESVFADDSLDILPTTGLGTVAIRFASSCSNSPGSKTIFLMATSHARSAEGPSACRTKPTWAIRCLKCKPQAIGTQIDQYWDEYLDVRLDERVISIASDWKADGRKVLQALYMAFMSLDSTGKGQAH